MPSISPKELSSISDQLSFEQLLIKKYKLYAGICKDQQMKIQYEQIAAEHQNHYRRLLNLLN